jgi:hypothetical protein
MSPVIAREQILRASLKGLATEQKKSEGIGQLEVPSISPSLY